MIINWQLKNVNKPPSERLFQGLQALARHRSKRTANARNVSFSKFATTVYLLLFLLIDLDHCLIVTKADLKWKLTVAYLKILEYFKIVYVQLALFDLSLFALFKIACKTLWNKIMVDFDKMTSLGLFVENNSRGSRQSK